VELIKAASSGHRGESPKEAFYPPFSAISLYLHQFDRALESSYIPFVRYADDFLLFAQTRKEAVEAMDFAAEKLGRLGLEMHREKSRVIRSGPEVVFLGERLPRPSR